MAFECDVTVRWSKSGSSKGFRQFISVRILLLLWTVIQACNSVDGCETPLPRFTEVVYNVTVVQGRDATLKCSVSNLKCSGDHHNSYKVAWVKADTQTLLSIEDTMISRNYRLRVSHSDANTWFLHIDKVKLSDEGYYMCQVNTVPMMYKKGFLQVVVPPNIIDDATSGDVEVMEDAPASIRCQASGSPPPEVTFKREDARTIREGGSSGVKIETESEVKDGTEITTTTLKFSTTGRTDMGRYLCIASNSVPPIVSKRISLNVRYREPEVSISHQMVGVYLGDEVIIDCRVTSYPPPVVYWTKMNNKMIISTGRFLVTETQVSDSPPIVISSLHISSVERSDVTTYRCSATLNSDNSRRKSLTVQLNEIERPSTEISNNELFYSVPRPEENNYRNYPTKHNMVNKSENRTKVTTRDRVTKTNFLPPNMFMHPGNRADNMEQSGKPSRPTGRRHSLSSAKRQATESPLVLFALLCLLLE